LSFNSFYIRFPYFHLLELYFARCGNYPGQADCTTGSQDLSVALANESSQVPKDPDGSEYLYVSTNDGLGYVIGANLQRDNNVLGNDYDGSELGCSGDLVYCVSSD